MQNYVIVVGLHVVVFVKIAQTVDMIFTIVVIFYPQINKLFILFI